MTLSPVLRYLVHQLQNGQTTRTIVLQELIWKMAGIEPLPSLSDTQIQAMAGGLAPRIELIASSTQGAQMDPSNGVDLLRDLVKCSSKHLLCLFGVFR